MKGNDLLIIFTIVPLIAPMEVLAREEEKRTVKIVIDEPGIGEEEVAEPIQPAEEPRIKVHPGGEEVFFEIEWGGETGYREDVPLMEEERRVSKRAARRRRGRGSILSGVSGRWFKNAIIMEKEGVAFKLWGSFEEFFDVTSTSPFIGGADLEFSRFNAIGIYYMYGHTELERKYFRTTIGGSIYYHLYLLDILLPNHVVRPFAGISFGYNVRYGYQYDSLDERWVDDFSNENLFGITGGVDTGYRYLFFRICYLYSFLPDSPLSRLLMGAVMRF